jgi:hypothetical protein
MIFFSKRSREQEPSSNSEACLSILGLFLAIGIIGGAAGLIYGKKSNLSHFIFYLSV